MANYLTYDLEVLANSSAEINQIAERLKQPSTELVNWVAEKYGESVNEIAEHLRELVAFEATSDAIATGDPEDGPQMRNFEVSFKNNGASGLVDSHLFEVSKAFPKPVLLLEYYDEMTSYSGKMVIRAGKIVQSMYDGYHRAQSIEKKVVVLPTGARPYGTTAQLIENMQRFIRDFYHAPEIWVEI